MQVRERQLKHTGSSTGGSTGKQQCACSDNIAVSPAMPALLCWCQRKTAKQAGPHGSDTMYDCACLHSCLALEVLSHLQVPSEIVCRASLAACPCTLSPLQLPAGRPKKTMMRMVSIGPRDGAFSSWQSTIDDLVKAPAPRLFPLLKVCISR